MTYKSGARTPAEESMSVMSKSILWAGTCLKHAVRRRGDKDLKLSWYTYLIICAPSMQAEEAHRSRSV